MKTIVCVREDGSCVKVSGRHPEPYDLAAAVERGSVLTSVLSDHTIEQVLLGTSVLIAVQTQDQPRAKRAKK